ncbi:hypothetical protein Tco_0067543 [Tanacetum coccineum]
MVAYLLKPEGSEDFNQIVDFLNTSHIKYALTKNHTIHVSLIQQFWQTASASTSENGEMEIVTTIDGRVKTVTEASIRRHLKLEDSDGISTLPNVEIFEQLALMGNVSNSDKLTFQKGMVKNLDTKSKFLMYPRFIQIFLNKHKRLLLPHNRTYIAPTLTYKLFSNMRRASKGYTGEDIPLFPTMLVQGPNLQGQGSTVQSDSHHITTSAPSTSQPPTSSPSMQTTHVTEEAATLPHDSPLPRVHSLGSDEGSMTLHELMVKRLEKEVKLNKGKRRAKIAMSDDEDAKKDTSKQGRKAHSQGSQPEDQLGVFSAAKILADVARVHTYSRRRWTISTGSSGISTAKESVSTAGASMPISTTGMDQGSIPSPSASKDKGKAIMTESEPKQATTKLKQRQEIASYEAAIRLQKQLDEEESQRIARDAKDFIDAEWDDILARVVADEDLVQQLQAGKKYSEEDLPMKLVELVNQRKKFFTQQRAEAKRNKPMTPAQQKVKENFEATMRRVQSFVPMDFELEVQRLKRAGQEVFEETAKRQKIEEASGSGKEQSAEKEKELSEEEL